MSKQCTKGTSCKGTCISKEDKCRVLLGETQSTVLDKVVEKILTSKQYLSTKKKAADWLESHKNQLVMSQLGSWGDAKGDLVVFAIEPGNNPGQEYYDPQKKMMPRLAKIKEEDSSPLADRDWGKWYDNHPLAFVNDIRQRLQIRNVLKRNGGGDFAPGHEVVKNFKPWDPQLEGPHKFQRENFSGKGLSPFSRKLGQMGKDSEWNSIMGMNLSPFPLPSDKYWPFEKLPFSENSPLKTRAKWLKYSADRITDSMKEVINEHPRKIVMFAANKPEHQKMFKEVANNLGGTVSSTVLKWGSKNGNEMKVPVNAFVIDGPNGRTVFVQTNHPSWTGWSTEALGEVSKIIKEKQNE